MQLGFQQRQRGWDRGLSGLFLGMLSRGSGVLDILFLVLRWESRWLGMLLLVRKERAHFVQASKGEIGRASKVPLLRSPAHGAIGIPVGSAALEPFFAKSAG